MHPIGDSRIYATKLFDECKELLSEHGQQGSSPGEIMFLKGLSTVREQTFAKVAVQFVTNDHRHFRSLVFRKILC